MKIESSLLEKIERFVLDLLKDESPKIYLYHTPGHTTEVVSNAVHIGHQENLTEEEMNILLAAAWFHDVGYLKTYYGHEIESAEIADIFLKQNGVDANTRDIVFETIMATTFPHSPITRVAKVLCDADFMHLGKPNYFEKAEALRQELNNVSVRKTKRAEFEQNSLKMFEQHQWHTEYCKNTLEKVKKKNMEKLKEQIASRNTTKKDDSKPKSYSRGVDSMYRLTARNQINLSRIADNKSNILISLNGILISLALATLVSKFREEPAIILPTIVFILSSLATIILATLSTRPNISSGKFTREDIKQKKVNLLFFGNFYNMDLEDYEWAVNEMINDGPYLYSALTKDQYLLGRVLAKKYRLLRWAYYVFMVGMILSVVAFLLVFIKFS